MAGRVFKIAEASNGGWIVTERLGTDDDGSVLVSTMAAFTDTADMISGLGGLLQPDTGDGETVAMEAGDV